MKKILVIILGIYVIVPVIQADDSSVQALKQKVEEGLNPAVIVKGKTLWTLRERMKHHGVAGVSLAVIKDYKIHWAKGYGHANKKLKQPVTNSTLFQAASISKPVTAVLALRLVQDGLLDLDRDINLQLTSWKVPENQFTRQKKVTLRMLLSHNAGLTVHGFRGYGKGEKVPTILDVLHGRPPSNSAAIVVDKLPGSGYRYSGGGYTVLQMLIEDVTRRSLADLAEEYIMNPSGMRHSSFKKPLPRSLAQMISVPHSREGEPLPPHWFLKGGSACCGLWTTSSDLARFAIEIQKIVRGDKERILTPKMGREMLTPASSQFMGLGFALDNRDGAVYFRHSGGNPPGYTCILYASRDKGYGAAIMTNSNGGGALYRELLQSVARAYHWDGFHMDTFPTISKMIQHYRNLYANDPKDQRISENRINSLGYSILTNNPKEAVEVFKMNCEFYPRSANCYDSLADGYMAVKDHKNALACSRKVMEILDKYPERNNQSQRLRELTKNKIKKLEQKK